MARYSEICPISSLFDSYRTEYMYLKQPVMAEASFANDTLGSREDNLEGSTGTFPWHLFL